MRGTPLPNGNNCNHHSQCEVYNDVAMAERKIICNQLGKDSRPCRCRNCEVCSNNMLLSANVSKCGPHKQPLSHWWEVPHGSDFKRGAASSPISKQKVSSASAQSDLAFEGSNTYSGHKKATYSGHKKAPMMPRKARLPDAEGDHDLSMDPCTDDVISPRLENPGECPADRSVCQDVFHKERVKKWSDKEGKMVFQHDIFNEDMPCTDEVGLQWRISELRVALQASERLRIESEHETEALRKYLAEVEAAASGLQVRVQELEQLVTISSKDELDKLRAKLVMEVTKEARIQTAKAAKAVVAAREATMELDKVKRHASSLIKAQEEEAERLRMEAAECRTLYQARAVHLQALKDQLEKMESGRSTPSNIASKALKLSQEEVARLQRDLEAAKIETQEKNKQFAELLAEFESQRRDLQTLGKHLKEMEGEKGELSNNNEWLEKQATSLQGAEKQHLLRDLDMLHSQNEKLQSELAEWQEKYISLSEHARPGTFLKASTTGSDMKSLPLRVVQRNAKEMQATGELQSYLDDCDGAPSMKSYDETLEPAQMDGQVTLIPRLNSKYCLSPINRMKHYLNGSDNKENWLTNEGIREHRRGEGRRMGCNPLKDNLLAAAHREIMRLKEINRCLMAACKDESIPCKSSNKDQ